MLRRCKFENPTHLFCFVFSDRSHAALNALFCGTLLINTNLYHIRYSVDTDVRAARFFFSLFWRSAAFRRDRTFWPKWYRCSPRAHRESPIVLLHQRSRTATCRSQETDFYKTIVRALFSNCSLLFSFVIGLREAADSLLRDVSH